MAVGARKRAKLRSLAAAWLRECGHRVPRHRELRFDVVGLRLDRDQVELAPDRGGASVAGDDQPAVALEQGGDQVLGTATESLAGGSHRRPR